MRRKSIITISIFVYVFGLIFMFFGVQKYIEKKDDRLRREIRAKLYNVFNGRSYIDVFYSGNNVSYDKMAIPKKPKYESYYDEMEFLKSSYQNKLDIWKDYYGNIYNMHQLKWADDKEGWSFIKYVHDHDGYMVTYLFPYAVGYINQYAPSVQDAVENAFEFYTTNSKSRLIDEFEFGSSNKLHSSINACSNEYYTIVMDQFPRVWRSAENITGEKEPSNSIPKLPIQAGYMYNNYYKVYIAETQPKTYSITKKPWNPDEEEKMVLWLYWFLGLTLIFLSIVIPIGIIERKRNKINEESLYDKLLRLCNPANFMKDYNKDKVEKANEIYQRLLEVDKNDNESINEIQLKAVSELGVNLIDSEKLSELKEKVNPKNFMNPYNAEKVKIANELFSILLKENLTFGELVYVEEMSEQLY